MLCRHLPPVLPGVGAVEGGEEASRALLWLVSCMQLVASHASRIAPSTYLWELIYPKENGMPVASASGKYAVRLYDRTGTGVPAETKVTHACLPVAGPSQPT